MGKSEFGRLFVLCLNRIYYFLFIKLGIWESEYFFTENTCISYIELLSASCKDNSLIHCIPTLCAIPNLKAECPQTCGSCSKYRNLNC